jgi:hypothetical protein
MSKKHVSIKLPNYGPRQISTLQNMTYASQSPWRSDAKISSNMHTRKRYVAEPRRLPRVHLTQQRSKTTALHALPRVRKEPEDKKNTPADLKGLAAKTEGS